MQMTAVYSCVRILSEAVAGLPLHLYRYTEEGSKEKATSHPLYFLLHDEPNPEMTSFVFRETLMTHLLLWGNAYAQIIRNGKGEVIALYPLMPDRMAVDRDDKGRLYYEYTVNTEDAPTMKGSLVRLSPTDVLHIPGLGFDGLVGYSPIAMAKKRHRHGDSLRGIRGEVLRNGAQPSGVLEHPGDDQGPKPCEGELDADLAAATMRTKGGRLRGGHEIHAHLHLAGAGAVFWKRGNSRSMRLREDFPCASAHGG